MNRSHSHAPPPVPVPYAVVCCVLVQYQVFFTLFLALIMKAGPTFIDTATSITPQEV